MNDKKKALKDAGAHYIRGYGWYFNISSKWEIEEDDSSALFLGANFKDAFIEMCEINALEDAQGEYL